MAIVAGFVASVIGFVAGMCVGSYLALKHEEELQDAIAAKNARLRAEGWKR